MTSKVGRNRWTGVYAALFCQPLHIPHVLPPSPTFLLQSITIFITHITMAAAQGYPLLCLENPLLGK